jgi:hypothetical protein
VLTAQPPSAACVPSTLLLASVPPTRPPSPCSPSLAAVPRAFLQEEMLGKLKDLGNTLLGKFGLSLDNFKAVKDPQSGSYSISFQR